MQTVKTTHAFGAGDTIIDSQKLHENGFINTIRAVVPNFATAATVTVSIVDEDSVVIYTSSALNKNATTVVTTLDVPIDRGYLVRVTSNAVAGAGGGTCTVRLYIKNKS